MMGRWLLLILMSSVCFCVTSSFADETTTELDTKQPIEITANQLEILQQQRQSIFSGDVIAKQGDMTLSAEKMIVLFQEEQDQVKRLDAIGSVRVVQLDRVATADRVVFYQLDEKLVLIGSAEVIQGGNKVSGEEITLYLKENRTLIKSSETKRVKAVIIPQAKSEEL